MDSPAPPPAFDTIRVHVDEVDGQRGTVQLARPQHLNPLSTHTLRELELAARWFDDQPELKVVVVSGDGRAWSSGADLAGFGGTPGSPASAGRSGRDGREQGGRMAKA